VTGVSPAEHVRFFANLEFDPQRHFKEIVVWVRGADRGANPMASGTTPAGITQPRALDWPATVGATGIDYLIPEYWRISGPTEDLNPSDRYLIAALSRPAGLLAQMQDSVGHI